MTPNFLQVFDVDDGRAPCPLRTQTVTAPQALFLMNSDEIDKASARFGERLKKESNGDLQAASTSLIESRWLGRRRLRRGNAVPGISRQRSSPLEGLCLAAVQPG